MSCSEGHDTGAAPSVEREIDLPAAPADVWEALPGSLGDDVELTAEPGGRLRVGGPGGERVGVVEEAEAPSRLSFWWVPADGDEAPSRVEMELEAIPAGTRIRIRETRFDSASVVEVLTRGPSALARA